MKNISFKEGEGKRVKVKKKQLLSMLIAWEKKSDFGLGCVSVSPW